MGNLEVCCYVKNIHESRRNWEFNILLTDSLSLKEPEKLLETSRRIIENGNLDEKIKIKYLQELSVSYYKYLMEFGHTYEDIYFLLKQEFNKYYDRPNSSTIVSALAFELDCLNEAVKNDGVAMNLFEYVDNNDLFITNPNCLKKRRSL